MTERMSNGPTRVAGPRVHLLSIVSTAVLLLFLAAVLTLFIADFLYIEPRAIRDVLRDPAVLASIRLSAITSLATLIAVIACAVPIGYALSRQRLPGKTLIDTAIDLPIVLPTIVIGVSLLVFFRTPIGRWIESTGIRFVYAVPGIILCQFFVSASYAIRATKAAFDAVDRGIEELALTLGCTRAGAFFKVALPLARNGIIAGAIMAWARAVGVFGPLMVFAGTVRMKTEVMPTTIYLELSVGRIEAALAVALIMSLMAAAALAAIHLLSSGRRWWGL